MSNRSAAKEQKRAQAKRERKARDQRRKLLNSQALKRMREAVEGMNAKGLAALWGAPFQEVEKLRLRDPHKVFVDAPRYFDEFRRRMDAAGATTAINSFADFMDQATFSTLELYPPGLVMRCPGFEGDAAEPVPLPGSLLYCTKGPVRWLEREFDDHWVGLVAWLTWTHAQSAFPHPTVIAMDRNGRMALWFIDNDKTWHPASQARSFMEWQGRGLLDPAPDGGLDQLMPFCGVQAPQETSPTRADDPAVMRAVDIVRAAQQPLVEGVLYLAGLHQKSEERLDQAMKVLDASGRLYRDKLRLESRIREAESERDSARKALRLAQSALLADRAVRPIPLRKRLAEVFG